MTNDTSTQSGSDNPVQDGSATPGVMPAPYVFQVGEVGQVTRGTRATRGQNAKVLAVSSEHKTYAVELLSDGSFHTVPFANFGKAAPITVTEGQIVEALNAANLYDNSHNAALLAEFEKIVPGVTEKITLR